MNTIFFIGLFLFVSSTKFDPYVHAVLPAIPAGVEEHAMVFMYPSGTATFLGDWGTAVPAKYETWDYVKLQPGDRVSFQATPASGKPAVPNELAHLQKKCTKFDHLKSGFTTPNFASAPAVVDIRYGALMAVTAFSPNHSIWRMDTRLQYDSGGPLVMTVVHAGIARALVLPRGSCGVFAYIPKAALLGSYHYDHDGSPHALAYLAMVDSSSAIDCWKAQNTTQKSSTLKTAQPSPTNPACPPLYEPWVPRPGAATPTNATASATLRRGTGPSIVGPTCPLPFQPMDAPVLCPQPAGFMNADCSNTQWP